MQWNEELLKRGFGQRTMDKGQRTENWGQRTEDRGQRPLSDVGCPLSSVPGNLLIPFAVHTAKFGYDWSNVPEGVTRDELDACYRAAIARKPEYLAVGEIVSGVAEAKGRRFAFSIQVAEAWDANGRNAEYCAIAFAPPLVADRLDLQALLERDEFRVPSRTPPKRVPCGFRSAAATAPHPMSAPPVQEAPCPAPSAVDGETDWLNVAIWALSAIAALIAIIAACKS